MIKVMSKVLIKAYEGFSQKSRHISENTKLTSKKKKLLSEKKSWTLKGECTPEKKAGDNSISWRVRKRKAAHDTTYEYFHSLTLTKCALRTVLDSHPSHSAQTQPVVYPGRQSQCARAIIGHFCYEGTIEKKMVRYG